MPPSSGSGAAAGGVPGLGCVAFAGLVRQLRTAHILRDLADAAGCYPHAHRPTQLADALRDLIHTANTARTAGHDAIDAELLHTRIGWLRAGVAVGLSEVDRSPDPKGKQRPGRCLLEMLRARLTEMSATTAPRHGATNAAVRRSARLNGPTSVSASPGSLDLREIATARSARESP